VVNSLKIEEILILVGFQVCQLIRKEFATSQVPIIFLSANNQRENIEKGYEVGADAFFSKPFEKVELLKIVSELLSKNNPP
jgi:DNA-binding response OmpR family regulator